MAPKPSGNGPVWRNLYTLLEEERILTQNLVVGAGTIAAGVLGVAFQVLVAHRFKPSDYGDVFAVVTLITLISLPAGAFTLLQARETSRDRASGQAAQSAVLLRRASRALLLAGLVIGGVLALGSPLVGPLLGVPSALLVGAAMGIPASLALPLLMGEFQGEQHFVTFAVLAVAQAGAKLIAAVGLGVLLGPIGVITDLAVILPSTFSLSVLLSVDVLFVKHFFSSQLSGEYAAVAALGRAIFWGASGIAIVLFPKVIFRRTKGLNGFLLVNASVLLVALAGIFGLIILATGAAPLLSVFAGVKYSAGASYLPLYGIAMTLLGGVAVLNAAHQTRGKPAFLAVLVPLTALEPLILLRYHGSLTEVVNVVVVCSALLVGGLAALYIFQERVPRTALPTLARRAQPAADVPDKDFGALASELTAGRHDGRPIRILILNWRCPRHPHTGGAERFTHEVARRLVARGHAVEWFSSSFKGAPCEEELDGVRMVRAGNRWTVYWNAFRRYRKIVYQNFDVVIDEVNVVPFFTPLWCKLPVFMLIHQLAREIWWYEASAPLNVFGFLVEPLYLRFYRNVNVLTVSTSTRDDLHRMGFKGVVTLVPEGVETIQHVSAEKPVTPSFLYVGRLVPSKRIEHILLAMARFREATGTGSLWLVGGGSPRYERSILRLARRLGLEDAITFCGRMSASDKHQLMARSHALLMTSVREGWGLVVTEANACGTPAIVYDVPGLRDSVRHESTGLVVKPRPEFLAEAMIRLTRDQRFYSVLVAGAQKWSSRFTFDETARLVDQTLLADLAVEGESPRGVEDSKAEPSLIS